MSSTKKTNVPQLTFEKSGISLPKESEILQGVIQDFQSAFGNRLKFYNDKNDFLLSTPQGQLATSIAAIISDRNRLLAYYVNQVDPSYATGRMQDGIGRIYFIERRVATKTTVIGTCSGALGTEIPVGTRVKDIQGNVYQSLESGIIGQDRFVDIKFECLEEGPIACPANSLTERYQVIQGWESINNSEDGTIGVNVESQAQFEQRRRQSVAGNSVNSVDSIMAALLNLVDENKNAICQDAYVTENSIGDAMWNSGVYLKPHSIYICVAALNDEKSQQAIARTIWKKKSPGCDMNGDQVVTIIDDTMDDANKPLYQTPPTYQIAYSYANEVWIQFNIIMARPQTMPQLAEDQIKDAVFAAFTGEDGSERPRIGGQILASNFYPPIQKLGPWARIISLQIGRDNGDSDLVQMGINEIPKLDRNSISVVFNG